MSSVSEESSVGQKHPTEQVQNTSPVHLMRTWHTLVERCIFRLVLSLVENDSVSERFLRTVSAIMQRKHLDEVIEERSAARKCGNPVCPNRLAKDNSSSSSFTQERRYKIDTRRMVIQDRTEEEDRFCRAGCQQWTEQFCNEVMSDELPYIRTDTALKLIRLVFPEQAKREELLKLKRKVDKLFQQSARDADSSTMPLALKVVERGFGKKDRRKFVESVSRVQDNASKEASQLVEGYGGNSTSASQGHIADKDSRSTEQDILIQHDTQTSQGATDKIQGTRGKIKKVSFADSVTNDSKRATSEKSGTMQDYHKMLEFNKFIMNKFLFDPFPQDWFLDGEGDGDHTNGDTSNDGGVDGDAYGNDDDDNVDHQNNDEGNNDDSVLLLERDDEPLRDVKMSKFGVYWTLLSNWTTSATVQFMNRKLRDGVWKHGEESTGQEGHLNLKAEDLQALRIARDLYQEECQVDIFSAEVQMRKDDPDTRRNPPRRPKRVARKSQSHSTSSSSATSDQDDSTAAEHSATRQIIEDSSSKTSTSVPGNEIAMPVPSTDTELQRMKLVGTNLSRTVSLVCREIQFKNASYLDSLVADLTRTFSYKDVLPALSQSDWKAISCIIVRAFADTDEAVSTHIDRELLEEKLGDLDVNDNQARLLSSVIKNGY